jgi:predicted TIM-barrel enzyme
LRRTNIDAAGSGLGTTIKYLRGAASVGLSTTIKYLRRSTSATAGNGLGSTIKYLGGVASIGMGTRRSTSDAQQAASRATAWAPRSIICDKQRASIRALT